MKIGIFDSGCGGLSTLGAVQRLLPAAEFFYIGDRAHCPYGEKTPAELIAITSAIVQRLADWGAEIVVIACNTATTNCIAALRQHFPAITFVGTEPAIKVAHDAGCRRPLLLATTATVQSAQVDRLAANSTLARCACPGLADVIEQSVAGFSGELFLSPYSSIPSFPLSTAGRQSIQSHLRHLFAAGEAVAPAFAPDAVILGCTHYVLARSEIEPFFPTARFFDGNLGTARRVRSLAKLL